MLVLKPDDNQGMRTLLLAALLRRGDTAGTKALLSVYADVKRHQEPVLPHSRYRQQVCEHRKPLSKRPLSGPIAPAAEVHASEERSLGNLPSLSATFRQAAGEACTENAEGPVYPVA